jgi:TolB protein
MPSEPAHGVSPAPGIAIPSRLQNQVIFTASSKPEWEADVFAISPDGSGRTNLTRSPEWEFDPVLSRDGTRIAFAAFGDASARRTDIYMMNSDGTQRRQVTHSAPGTLAAAPSWSPDAKQIAFFTIPFQPALGRGGEAPSSQLCVIDADGGNVRKLGTGMAPVWSPDGRQMLYFDAKGRLSVMDADGKNPRPLTDPAVAFGASAAWSPDGKRFASIASESGVGQVFVMAADGSGRTRLTSTAYEKSGVQWTRDGKQIVFTRVKPSPFVWPEESAVFIMSADGKEERKLVADALTGGGPYGAIWVRPLIVMKVEAAREGVR